MNRTDLNEALVLTDEQLDELARPFEEGNWDASAYAPAQHEQPSLLDARMESVSFKETPSNISKIDERAKSQGKTRSDYLRSLVAADLATA